MQEEKKRFRKIFKVTFIVTGILAAVSVLLKLTLDVPKIVLTFKLLTAILLVVDTYLAKKGKDNQSFINCLTFLVMWIGFVVMDILRM